MVFIMLGLENTCIVVADNPCQKTLCLHRQMDLIEIIQSIAGLESQISPHCLQHYYNVVLTRVL